MAEISETTKVGLQELARENPEGGGERVTEPDRDEGGRR